MRKYWVLVISGNRNDCEFAMSYLHQLKALLQSSRIILVAKSHSLIVQQIFNYIIHFLLVHCIFLDFFYSPQPQRVSQNEQHEVIFLLPELTDEEDKARVGEEGDFSVHLLLKNSSGLLHLTPLLFSSWTQRHRFPRRTRYSRRVLHVSYSSVRKVLPSRTATLDFTTSSNTCSSDVFSSWVVSSSLSLTSS